MKYVYMTFIISIEWYVDSAEITDLYAIITSDTYEMFNIKKWMLQDCFKVADKAVAYFILRNSFRNFQVKTMQTKL